MDISKHDWKLFREKIGEWQNRHMDKLCREYVQILTGESDASVRFWELEKRIRKDKKNPGVQIEPAKDMVVFHIAELIQNGTITTDDLNDFSDGLRETVAHILSLS